MALNFEHLYKSVVFGLRAGRSHPDIPRNLRWFAEFGAMSVNNYICTFWLLNSILFYDVKGDNLINAYRNSTMVVMSFVVNLKYCILLYYQDTALAVLNSIDSDYRTSEEWPENEQKIVSIYTRKAYDVGKIWCLLAIATSTLFPIKSVVLMLYYYSKGEFHLVPMFDMCYPSMIEAYKNELGVFVGLYAMHMIFAINCAAMFMGFEPLGPIFVVHACSLLEVTIVRLSKLFEGSAQTVGLRLKECNIMLQKVYRFVNEINKIFTLMYEINITFTPLMISLIAFQLLESLKQGEPNLEFTSLFFGVIVYFFIPCYYSDLLKELGNKVREALYTCQWENHRDLSVRKTIIIMMTRSFHPPTIRSYFYTVCLDTFAKMCRSAYTFFNMMNVAWN